MPDTARGKFETKIDLSFSATIEWDDLDKMYVAECPDIPGAITQGRTRREAIANLREAATGVLWVRLRSEGSPPE